jgi:nucleotidyltransferase substrate binding protein (TIGR01987 family)
MAGKEDVRWIQRFSNYRQALSKLAEAVHLNNERTLSELEKQGLIQAFEYTHELAWKVMQDFLVHQGYTEIRGSRDATREAFKTELIIDGENWMEMIKKRNLTSHTYNEQTSEEIRKSVTEVFYPLFVAFGKVMENLISKEETL